MKYISGVKELQKKLSTLAKKHARAAIRKATRAACKAILPTAKANAPIKSGQLRRNLKIRSLPRSRIWIGTRIRLDYTGPTFYGAFVEYGTKFIHARHFLKDAIDRMKDSALAKAVQTIKQEIESRMKL